MRLNPLTSRSSDAEIEGAVMTWLRLAKDRDGGRQRRASRAAVLPAESTQDRIV